MVDGRLGWIFSCCEGVQERGGRWLIPRRRSPDIQTQPALRLIYARRQEVVIAPTSHKDGGCGTHTHKEKGCSAAGLSRVSRLLSGGSRPTDGLTPGTQDSPRVRNLSTTGLPGDQESLSFTLRSSVEPEVVWKCHQDLATGGRRGMAMRSGYSGPAPCSVLPRCRPRVCG